MIVNLDGDTVRSVKVIGGCNGNLQGIAKLVEGMKADEVIARLKGIKCGGKPTSCPDQLAVALTKAKDCLAKDCLAKEDSAPNKN